MEILEVEFTKWFREKFHRDPGDAEMDKMMRECFEAGKSSNCRIKLDLVAVDILLSPCGNSLYNQSFLFLDGS